MDAPIYPEFEGRNFDYYSMSLVCDYIFVMAYDGQFWNNVQCADQVNGTNCSLACSSYSEDEYGITQYLAQGVSANKLIIGYPWYS